MTCMTASNADLFDPMVFTIVRRRASENKSLPMPRNLFDFPIEPARRRMFDWSLLPDEDLERWDGLS